MHDNRALNQFEREEDGALVFARYRLDDGVIVIRHVEAAPALRGTGAADRLMREIVEKARTDNTTIRPLCGYASAWLRRHARDLIATS